MKEFVRVSKLTDISGRADFISDPARQDAIVAASSPVDWEPYRVFEHEHRKTATKNIEGREMMVALPNEWAGLAEAELSRRAEFLARLIVGDALAAQWAVHWNKTYTNLHVHVIFSERQRVADPGRWDRNIYLTADGRVAKCKADRAVDEDGNYILLHKKGALKGAFSTKDPCFKERSWLRDVKVKLREEMQDRWGVQFGQNSLLHEYHEGEGKDATKIRKKNEAIRAMNGVWDEYIRVHPDVSDDVKENFKRAAINAAKRGEVIDLD